MGIFTNFNVSDFSKPLPPFHLFATIGFEATGQYNLEIELHSIEGEKRFSMVASASVTSHDEARNAYVTNLDLKFENLLIPRPGLYEFVIRSAGQSFATLPFTAKVHQPKFVQ